MKNNPAPIKKPLLLASLIGLAGGILAAVIAVGLPNGSAPPPLPKQSATGTALIGGPFTLVDGSGKAVTEKDFAGKPMLVYFGFTHCPDICPSGLQIIAAALDKLGPKADGVTPLFITLDPERDTPALIGEYVKSFSPRIVGLSGTPADIAAVTKAYRVYARKTEPDPKDGSYSVDHSSFMYLMSNTGELLKHFPHTVDPDVLAQEIAKVL